MERREKRKVEDRKGEERRVNDRVILRISFVIAPLVI